MPVAAGVGPFGVPELLIIAFIIILIFGVGRLPEVGGALGKGIREFRRASTEDTDKSSEPSLDAGASSAPTSSNMSGAASAASAGESRFCSECGERNAASAKFCSKCGHAMSVMAS
jgi:sec-independent protein translocase protein TatA